MKPAVLSGGRETRPRAGFFVGEGSRRFPDRLLVVFQVQDQRAVRELLYPDSAGQRHQFAPLRNGGSGDVDGAGQGGGRAEVFDSVLGLHTA
jgi:hypothetical protein